MIRTPVTPANLATTEGSSVDRATIAAYEAGAADYAARRTADDVDRAEAFAAALEPGAHRLDLGCGPGLYLPHLGRPVVAGDAAHAMVRTALTRSEAALGVQCDLVDLPLRDGAVGGVWASKAHQHLAPHALPGALAELHRVLPVGGRLELTMFAGPPSDAGADDRLATEVTGADDDFPGRWFTWWPADSLAHLLVGAGFTVDELTVDTEGHRRVAVRATRARTLADSVDRGMRLLLCGLNPSVYSADAGVGYARPGNRFWPAMVAAGLATVDRDAHHLLRRHRIGLTDVVKRATVTAAELTADEYRGGLARVEHLSRLLGPAAIGFVGLAGWRAARDRRAGPGWQAEPLGEVPVYVLPSTSGLNAHTSPAELVDHLRAAAAGP